MAACSVPCAVGIAFPCEANASRIARFLLVAVEWAADENTQIYLGWMRAGKDVSGICCPGCAGYVHVPDLPGLASHVELVEQVMACEAASCGSAAAMAMGFERAVLIFDEGESEDEAYARIVAKIKYGQAPDGSNNGRYFHAVFVKDGEEIDPTKEMRAA
jgi:hypothetical protein